MNRATGRLLIATVGALICAPFLESAGSELADEISIPEPTPLKEVATATGSELVWSEIVGEIKSADAYAAISAIEILGLNGERARGVRVVLTRAEAFDEIHIPGDLLSQVRAELKEIEFTRRLEAGCKAESICVYGVARCRPSQSVKQALCLGGFSTPTSGRGLVLSTPRSSFFFPAVEVTQLDALIDQAAQILD